MARVIESSGEIEIRVASDAVVLLQPVDIVFGTHGDAEPPYSIEVRSPNGKLILTKTTRELPTGEAQSAPPVQFVPSSLGDYKITIKQIQGSQRGEAVLHVR